MLAIGRALMAGPRLLLLDEVSLGLAPKVIEDIFERLARRPPRLGTSMLLVEQNARRRARASPTTAYILESGRVVLEGPAAELRNNPAVQESYLGSRATSATTRSPRRKHYRRRRRWLS